MSLNVVAWLLIHARDLLVRVPRLLLAVAELNLISLKASRCL